MGRLTVDAHAKVNLDLRILAVRDDGYHELETVFQTLALHDTLTVVERPGPFSLTCDAPGVPVDASNLVWRAARAIWQAAGRPGEPTGVGVELTKRIPAEAGLGGGSADGAAALISLDRMWGTALGVPRLTDLAASLGADVPFFLMGGTALGRGRGDRLQPLPAVPSCHVVIVRPEFGVSTAAAYGWYDESEARPSASGTWPDRPAGWPAALATCRNDLEAAVAGRHPEIGELRQALERGGSRLALMSGSGSTVFGLFDRADLAQRAAAALGAAGRTVMVTETRDGPACHVRLPPGPGLV